MLAVRCGAAGRGERRGPQIGAKLAQGDLLGAFGALDAMDAQRRRVPVRVPPARSLRNGTRCTAAWKTLGRIGTRT